MKHFHEAPLKLLSDHFNLIHLGVGICWLSFFIHILIFPVFGMTNDFLLYAGHFGSSAMRLCILFSFLFLAGSSPGEVQCERRMGVYVQDPSGPWQDRLSKSRALTHTALLQKEGFLFSSPVCPIDTFRIKVGHRFLLHWALLPPGEGKKEAGGVLTSSTSNHRILSCCYWMGWRFISPLGPADPGESGVLTTPAAPPS